MKRPFMSRSRLNRALAAGFSGVHRRVSMNPRRYLLYLQRTHGLPIDTFAQMRDFPLDIIDPIADKTIGGATKWAAVEGAGLGLGGLFFLAPDMGVLAAITVRLIQKLSLLYGFEFATEEESTLLWIAAATAAGVDLGRDFLEKQAADHVVPLIIERMAARMSAEVAEQWGSRLIPMAGGAIGAALNYYFVREWGRRAKNHFRERHEHASSLHAYAAARGGIPALAQ